MDEKKELEIEEEFIKVVGDDEEVTNEVESEVE